MPRWLPSLQYQPTSTTFFRPVLAPVAIYYKDERDLQLLARYVRDQAEDAFAVIVRRHIDLVFSTALRQVRSPELAEEVAQSVFQDLARQAHCLAPDVVRRETRRQLREQAACELNAMNTDPSDWTHIEPLLEQAMDALDASDRSAILLR